MERAKLHVLIALLALSGCMSEQERQRVRSTEVSKLFANHPEWSQEIRMAILYQYITIGMTPKQVEWALWPWNSYFSANDSPSNYERVRVPRFISSDSSGSSTYEASPVLSDGRAGTMYYFFRNGKLASWSFTNY